MKDETSVVQTFINQDFGEIRTVTLEGEIWFVAVDVCKALEIKNVSDAVERLDDDEKNTIVINEGIAGNPNKAIVSEAGLYRLIFTSRKPDAKKFQRWIYHEVIPSIRKTGSYNTNNAPNSELQEKMNYLIKLCELAPTDNLKEEIIKRAATLIDGKESPAKSFKPKKRRKFRHLSLAQIEEIRRLHQDEGLYIRDIARLFHVSIGTVCNAINEDPA